MSDLVESMKKAAIGAVESTKPVAVMFGTVISASPLKIHVEQKMNLDSMQLILTENLMKGTGLIIGDKILLLRMQGGQKFVVWDRIAK